MEQVAAVIAAGVLALPPQKAVEQGAVTSVLPAASPTGQGVTTALSTSPYPHP
ncbi:hypothetical protein AB0L59_16295 [Streptomyces sp. NPDC052109]|uniref:hypothetical protein n=1 Tax=Streptomyces sp. NPDC052109 TaxID=3155527 RepID=UPI003449C6F6